jgi:hypothetical protein
LIEWSTSNLPASLSHSVLWLEARKVRVGKLAERLFGAFVNVALALAGAAAAVTLAGVVVTWNPDATLNSGALLVAAAYACWGIDNCVTARIEHLSPGTVVIAKGLVAGTVNLTLGMAFAEGRPRRRRSGRSPWRCSPDAGTASIDAPPRWLRPALPIRAHIVAW